MSKIEIMMEYKFEVPIEDNDLEVEFNKLKDIIESETENFIIRNLHTFNTSKKILYELV